MATARTIAIRLGVDGAVELKQALESVGLTGTAAFEKVSAALTRLGAQNTGAVEAALDRIATKAAQVQAATGQAQANAFAGVQDPASDADYDKRAADIAAYGAELDRLRAKYVPLFAVSRQYETTLEEIGQAERLGAISAADAAAARDKATASFAAANAPTIAAAAAAGQHAVALDKTTVSAGAAAAAQRNLSIQVIQGVSGIATGQPILTTLIQQGHQVVDSSLAMGTGFGGVAKAAVGMVTAINPIVLAIGTVAVATATLIAVSESEARRQGDVREQLRATQVAYVALAAGVEESARRVAASSTLSTTEARQAAQTIASGKYFAGTGNDIDQLTKLSADLARVWNTDVAKASGVLRDAINDPAKAAKQFAEQGLPAFNAELVRSVERLQASGQGGTALAVVLDALKRSSAGAAADQTPLQKAMNDLEKSFYGAQAGGKSFAQSLGEALSVPVVGAIRLINDLIETIKNAGDAANRAAYQAAQNAATLRQGAQVGTSAVTTPDATGRQPLLGPPIANSAERAVGIFQVLPSTGRELGYNVNVQDQNIAAGLTYLQQRVNALGGVNPALAQYGGYGTDVGRASGYIGKVQGANTASLPTDVAGQIEYWGQVLGLTPDMIALGKRIAVVESGGRQYASSGQTGGSNAAGSRTTTPTAAALGIGGGDQVSAPTGQSALEGLRNNARAAKDELTGLVAGTNAVKAQDIADKLQGVNAQMERLRSEGKQGTAEYAGLVQTQNQLAAASNQLLTPQERYLRGLQDQNAANQGLFAGDQKLVEVRQRIAQIERDEGGSFTPAQKAQAETLALQGQSTELNRLVANTELGIDANQKLAAAYGQGHGAVAQVTAETQAYAAAIKLFPPGSDAARVATAKLTDEFVRQARSAQQAQVAQQNLAGRDNLDYIAAEASSLGMATDARTKMLAVMKAEQEMHRQFGDVLPAEAKAYIELAARTADATAAYQHQQAALDELSSFTDHTFSTISDAITASFAVGEHQAVKFGDVAKSVVNAIEAEFAKLALINPLKNALFGSNSNSTTLSDVGGLFGNLFGSGSTIDTSTPAALIAGAAGAANAFSGAGTTATTDASGNLVPASSGASLTSTLGYAGTAAKALDFVTGGKLLSGVKSFVFDQIGFTPGQSIGSWVSGLIGETPLATAATAGVAADVASGAAGAASDVGSLGATGAVGSVTGIADASVGTIGAAANTITEAIPYIGAAVSIITDLATGNLRGAAIVATTTAVGALVGSVVPGIGTAIGAGVGATVGVLIDTFFPQHPKNPFSNTEVDIVGGRIQAGKSVSQLEKTDAARDQVNKFGEQLGNFLDSIKVQIVGDGDHGKLGDLGSGIKGLAQVDSIDKLFSRLSFQNDASDTSNFGVAKGALQGMTFQSIGSFTDEILKIGRFSDGMDQLGIKLAAVGTDLTNISVASVSLTGALTDQATATDATGAPDPLRVALAHDLPGQQFANVDALAAEIDKVNTFVNGTIPGLLNPLLTSTSQLQQQISEVDAKYQDAIHQAEKYGLATQDLIDAQTKANSLLLAPGQIALNYQHVGIADRYTAATSGASLGTTLDAFDDQAHQQRDALQKALTDEFGDTIKSTAYYAGELANLEKTLGAERLKTAQQFAQQQAAALLGVGVTVFSVRARQDTLNGDDKAAELIGYDIKAAQERQSFAKTLTDFYGDAYASSAEYQGYMTELETVQQGERLAIVKKYGDQITTATANAMSQATSNVTSLFTSLGEYAAKLETGSSSPLSSTDQYAYASNQFNAVAGAAAAGDYTSASEYQNYADTFLTASRNVNGSGTQYAADFAKVLDGLSSISVVSDALTASAFQKVQQDQTAQLIASQQAEGAATRDAITALRREVQQQTNVLAA